MYYEPGVGSVRSRLGERDKTTQPMIKAGLAARSIAERLQKLQPRATREMAPSRMNTHLVGIRRCPMCGQPIK